MARARELTAEAENALETDPELSIHLALAALGPLREAGENTTQAVSALRAAIANDRVIFRSSGGNVVAVSPEGQLLATADVEDGEAVGVAVWDIEAQQIVERLATGLPGDLQFAPDGGSLFVVFRGADPSVMRWDLTTGQTTPFGPTETDSACCFALSPDSQLIAFETWNQEDEQELTAYEVQVWSLDDRGLVYRTPGWGPAFNADGLLSYSGGPEADPHIRVVDPITGDEVRSIATDLLPFSTSWSPDGTRIAVADDNGSSVIDVEKGIEVVRPILDRASDPEWLPGGDALVVGRRVGNTSD